MADDHQDDNLPFDEQQQPSSLRHLATKTKETDAPWQLFAVETTGNDDKTTEVNFFHAVSHTGNVEKKTATTAPAHDQPQTNSIIDDTEAIFDADNILFDLNKSSSPQLRRRKHDNNAASADTSAADNEIVGDIEDKAQETIEQSASGDKLVLLEHHQSNNEEVSDDDFAVQEIRNSHSMCRGVGGRKERWILIGLILVIFIAAITGGVLGSAKDDVTEAPSGAPSVSFAPSLSQVPSQVPTTFRSSAEAILAPYEPLNEDIKFWLIENSTWRPDQDNFYGYDYQFLERYAMAVLYNDTRGINWTNNDNWMSDSPTCAWAGALGSIGCPGPVTDLVLALNDLNGTLPSILFELTALTRIQLARNYLNGTIPEEIWNLRHHLSYLDLSSNNYNGSLPSILFELTQLRQINLARNNLTGTISEEIWNLHYLNYLDLSNNEFVGSIPIKFRRMENLEHLYLSGNNISSTLPYTIGDMSNLKVLSLYDNQFVGTIPKSIGRMSSLKDLSLFENNFTGKIPTTIGDLSSLSRLSLNANQLSGTIPRSIVNLSNLEWLSLQDNSLSGRVPKLPDNPKGNLNCFLGECFSDMYYAQLRKCITFSSC